MSEPTSIRGTPKEGPSPPPEPVIDPQLADLPPPPLHSNGASSSAASAPVTLSVPLRETPYPHRNPGDPMGITESIASAPNPHTAEFSPLPFTQDSSIDVTQLDDDAADEPGSPTARLLRAIAPPNACQPNPTWLPPPPNASVNLFIGRALLSNGNDNWPLKPNEIVNWIRKHYPDEWDGDEGRCSAHRVRTYLARKGADMYYEKLNQGCIAGWRIRQNHLWRFENGGFQGRGMKQEEAIAQQQKENEAMATAAHKAAAAAALAQGHPSVKVSMSSSGLDGPPNKRPRKSNGQARRKSEKKKDDSDYSAFADPYASAYLPHDQSASGLQLEDLEAAAASITQPPVQSAHASGTASVAGVEGDPNDLDVNMVHQALAASNTASGQMDELDMGIQLPIEMQMHSGTHDYDGEGHGYEGPYEYNTGQSQVYDGSYQHGQ